MTLIRCDACGGEHESTTMFNGQELVPCPKMPPGRVLICNSKRPGKETAIATILNANLRCAECCWTCEHKEIDGLNTTELRCKKLGDKGVRSVFVCNYWEKRK